MRKSILLLLAVVIAVSALLSACGDNDAPGAARRGFKWDAQNSDLELYVDGTKIVEWDDTGTEVTITGDLSTSGTATFGTGATITTGDFTNTAGGDLVGWQKNFETHAANDTLTITEVGSLHTSIAQNGYGNVTLTLPVSSTAGDQFYFVVGNGTIINKMKVRAPSGGAIYLDGTKGTDNYVIYAGAADATSEEGDSVSLLAIGSNDWVAWGRVGTWTAEIAF